MNKLGTPRTGGATQTRPGTGIGVLLQISLVFCILLGMANKAHAVQRGVFPVNAPQSYRAECGECHTAFAPDLLPVDAWQHIMDGLTQHFGVDASIDEREREEIGSFLARYAGTRLFVVKRGDPLRLTDTLWFHRMHGRIKVLFQDPRVVSKSNCTACHAHADEGRYDEYTRLSRKYMQEHYPRK